MDFDQVACLPLDVGKFEFNRALFDEMLEHDTLLQTGDARSSYVWKRKEVVLHAYGETIDDFFNVTTTCNSWYDRYEMKNFDGYRINPAFGTELKSEIQNMIDFILENIPIWPAHLTLVRSTGEVPMHCDCPPEQVHNFYNKGLEPANVKILLNVEDYDDTLFFQKFGTLHEKAETQIKHLEKEKHIPNDTNVMGWSENFHGHGAIYRNDEQTFRMLINVFGPLDKEKYRELRDRSWEKYHEHAITFEMDTNDSYTWQK
tara:strand:+ start:2124 stop:2900 length:777 start_codon:yes stop_codon:yes gene_type:complete